MYRSIVIKLPNHGLAGHWYTITNDLVLVLAFLPREWAWVLVLDFRNYSSEALWSKQAIMPRVGRGRGHDGGGGRGSYLHYLEQRSMGRLRRGAGDQINRNLALSMLNPPHRCGFLIELQQVGGWGDRTSGVEEYFSCSLWSFALCRDRSFPPHFEHSENPFYDIQHYMVDLQLSTDSKQRHRISYEYCKAHLKILPEPSQGDGKFSREQVRVGSPGGIFNIEFRLICVIQQSSDILMKTHFLTFSTSAPMARCSPPPARGRASCSSTHSPGGDPIFQ